MDFSVPPGDGRPAATAASAAARSERLTLAAWSHEARVMDSKFYKRSGLHFADTAWSPPVGMTALIENEWTSFNPAVAIRLALSSAHNDSFAIVARIYRPGIGTRVRGILYRYQRIQDARRN